MNSIRDLTRDMHAADILIILFSCLLTIINLVFASRIPNWGLLIGINVGATILIVALAVTRHRTGSKFLGYIHDWYHGPLVFFTFKELYYMIKPIHFGKDYDDWLIAADHWLFGVHPTQWIYQFHHPVLTELLQIAYTSFYFLFLIVGYEFYRKGQMDLFLYFMFTCIYGFFLSYLGYFIFPAIGPRFTLHDFSMIDTDLPGLWLTPLFRAFVNLGESIPMGVPNAVSMAASQRDVFPSGHTMMTLVLIYLASHWKVRSRYVMYTVGTMLIIATVYQRYHYVIDLVAGAVFMFICVRTSWPLYRFLKIRFQTVELKYYQ